MWNPRKHTDDENLRWCWLRAVEWDAYPFFISQPLVPLMLTTYVWWKILIGLFVIQVFWTAFVRTRFVNMGLSDSGKLIVMTKWVVCPVVAYKLYGTGHVALAALALLWPLAMLAVKYVAWMLMAFMLAPFGVELMQIGVIQQRLMQQLGYTRQPQ